MPGFSVYPGRAVLVTSSYVVKTMQTKVVLQGAAGGGVTGVMAGS